MLGHFGAIGTIISGLVNWFFLKSFKPLADKKSFIIWTALTHTKLLLVLFFFTPAIKIVGDDQLQNSIRIKVLAAFMFITPFVRRLRESFNPK